MAFPFIDLEPADNVVFSATRPCVFYVENALNLNPTTISVNGGTVASSLGLVVTNYSNDYVYTQTDYFSTLGYWEYKLAPVNGWTASSPVTVELDGEIIAVPYSQSRTFAIGEGFIADHTETALGRMLDQFHGSPDLRSLASSYTDQVQAFENAAAQLLHDRSIATGSGDRLDGIGQIVNVTRGGLEDREYRLRLQGELAILFSHGSITDILEIVQLLIPGLPDGDIEALDYYPKTLYIRPEDHPLTEDPQTIATLLRRAVSAATELLFVYGLYDDSALYTLSSQGATVETSTTLGLGNTTGGGYNYTYDANVGTGGSFGNGDIRFTAESPGDATLCRVQDIDGDAVDRDAWLDGLNGESVVVTTPAGNISFTVTGVTDVGAYHELDMGSVEVLGADPADQDAVNIWTVAATGGHLAGAA